MNKVQKEILDAIDIIADQKIKKSSPKILFGIVDSVYENNFCVVSINLIKHKVNYFGEVAPVLNKKYPIFVPASGMSNAFLISDCSAITFDEVIKAIGYTPGMTNPNLLDNPWFQINQRGESSYVGAVYGVDRWISRSSTITVAVNSDSSITVKNTGDSTAYFAQYLEDGALPAGKYTLSVNVLKATGTPNSNGNYGSAYLAYGSEPSFSSYVGITSSGAKIYSITLNPPDKVVRIQFAITAGCSITLKAVKLEIGFVSTLANDAAPNYVVELAKCQRYYFRIGGKAIYANIVGVAASSTTVNFIIPTPVSLRTSGTADITYGGNLFAALSASASDKFSITGFTWNGVQQNGFWVTATTSGVKKGSAYYLRLEGSSSVKSFLAVSKDL